MKKIIDGLYFIAGRDEMIPDSHTYIIGDPSSKDLTMIDPGLYGKGEYKINSIKKIGIELSDIKRIIMTHTHFDHISAILEVQEIIPWAELWIHRSEAELIEEGDERAVYGMEMFQQICQMEYKIKPKSFKMTIDRKLEGGEILNIGNMQWHVIHIPGHSLGSIGLYHSSEKILIPGDVIYSDYAIGRFDLFGADGKTLKESLKKLSALDIKILLPGHNQIITNLEQNYVSKTLRQWESYLV